MTRVVDMTNLTRGEETGWIDTVELRLPGGETVTLWVALLSDHTCIDVHRHRGRKVEEISARTGDTTCAPMGVMAWRNGVRHTLDRDAAPAIDAESHGWPAVSGMSLLWDLA